MASLSSLGGKLSNFGNTGTTPAPAVETPAGIGELIMAMGGWKINGVSPITPSITMSRPSNGVDNPEMWTAPCAVTFSGSGTTKTGETNQFRNLFFSWDFGDSAKDGEFWTTGARVGVRSKNKEIGPVAGHVYDTPGTYTITLTVLDAFGNINNITQQITISDADVVYAGNKTICYSSTGDFTGAPAGSTQTTETSWSDIWNGNFTLNAADKRILLRAGDVFDVDANINGASGVKNFVVGYFGSGAKPEIRYAAAAAAVNAMTISDNGETQYLDNITVFGLSITNPTGLTGKRFVSSNIRSASSTIEATNGRMCFINIDCDNVTPFNLQGYGNAVVGCTSVTPQVIPGVHGLGHNGLFHNNARMFYFDGNDFDNDETCEHVARIQGFRDIFVGNSRLKNPSGTKHCLALRGDGMTDSPAAWVADTTYAVGSVVQPTTPNDCLYRGVIAVNPAKSGAVEPTWTTTIGDRFTDNTMTWECLYNTADAGHFAFVSNFANVQNIYLDVDKTTPDYSITFMCQVAPNANTAYEPIEDVLINGMYVGPNMSPSAASHTVFDINAKRLTIRNLIVLGSSAGSYSIMFAVHGVNLGGNPASSDILVENASIYSPHTQTHLISDSEDGQTAINLKNVIIYAPNSNNNAAIISAPNEEFIFTNTSTLEQMKTVDPYATTPTSQDSFTLATDSYAIGGGVDVDGAFIDFFDTLRDRRVIDMGAISIDS
jgi:hypothetical protein